MLMVVRWLIQAKIYENYSSERENQGKKGKKSKKSSGIIVK